MNAIVIDRISEAQATCFLVKAKLSDYIFTLPEDYRSYEIQREIVNNTYLDNLIQTILEGRHIPQMVLVAEQSDLTPDRNTLETGPFKILDGLQRTYRLKIIYDTIKLAMEEISNSSSALSFNRIQLSRQFKEKLETIKSSSLLLGKIFDYYKSHPEPAPAILEKLFDRWQWFELWVNLEPKDEVNKMLILNAGHKAVKTQHQLELLFNNMIPVFKKLDFDGFELIREKELTSISYSKNRVQGQFHFSHLITSILSFNAGKPITNNVTLIQKAQAEDFDDTIFDKLINYEFLSKFIESLLYLDSKLATQYGETGVKWLGRETSLTGMFAACGRLSEQNNLYSVEALDQLKLKVGDNPAILKLNDFESERNSLDLAKVNIGSVNKKAVYNALFDVLSGRMESIEWSTYFKREI